MPDPETPLVRKLACYTALDPADRSCLAALEGSEVRLEPGIEVITQGMHRRYCYVLNEGWAACYKLVDDGGRQIINFSVPGDFLGLRSFLLRTADHSVVTLTEATVSQFPQERVLDLVRERPNLGAAVLWALAREEAMVVQHLVNVGRRSAIERLAHLLLELQARLAIIGRTAPDGFHCPITQDELGDALGLTAIHVNRILRQLRESGLATFARRRVEIHGYPALCDLAAFNVSYLDHHPQGMTEFPDERAAD